MKKKIELIKNTVLLEYLTEETIQSHIDNKQFRVVDYSKKSIIHFEGDFCENIEIILSGTVVVESIDENGNMLKVTDFRENDVLGGNLVFSRNSYYPMTVSTKTDVTILEINKHTLFNIFKLYPAVLRSYLELVSDNAYILGNKIRSYVKKTIRESIISYIKYESRIQNTRNIKIPMTKKEFAEKIGVQRTSLSRELAKMRDDGLIKFDRHTITLLK